MAITKQEAIRQLDRPGTLTHQEALVKKIAGVDSRTKIVKRPIPGGKNMATELPESKLPSAIYNWLRGCRHFTEATISLSKDIGSHKTKESKVIDFDPNSKHPEWDLRGKRWLADRCAEVFSTDNLIALYIKRDGIIAVVDEEGKFSPEDDSWEPYVEFAVFKPPVF